MSVRLSFASRLVLNCVGCGHEAAVVAIGPADDPDETYGARCWRDPSRWDSERPDHTHLDGRGCAESGEAP